MSYERMLKAEAELKARIDGLLTRAKAADDLEKHEPDIDICWLTFGSAPTRGSFMSRDWCVQQASMRRL